MAAVACVTSECLVRALVGGTRLESPRQRQQGLQGSETLQWKLPAQEGVAMAAGRSQHHCGQGLRYVALRGNTFQLKQALQGVTLRCAQHVGRRSLCSPFTELCPLE